MRSFEELAGEARDAKALTFVRKNAIQELAKSGDARALDVLEELVGDAQVSIRREAVTALGGVEGSRATQLLVRALGDDDRQCVKAALTQLGRRGDRTVVPVLEKLKETGHPSLRIEAGRLLKQLGVAREPVEEAEAPPEPEPQAPKREAPPVPPPPPPRAKRPAVEPPRAPVARSRGPDIEDVEVEEVPVEAPPEVPVAPRAEPQLPPTAPPAPPFTPRRQSGGPFPSPPPPNIPRRRLSRRQRDRLTPDRAYQMFDAMGKGREKPQGCKSSAQAVFIVVVMFIFFLILIGRCV